MKPTHLTLLATLLALPTAVHADTFGSGVNTFTIDFVTVGNPGNGIELGAGGGTSSSLYGGVAYLYRMGVTEVPMEWIDKATNLGLSRVAGHWSGLQPAGDITWYEAAEFVNWLNVSTGHQRAYDLRYMTLPNNVEVTSMALWSSAEAWQLGGQNLYRHKDAVYFLPSEDEWYKAAYHKNDGATANYWDYPTASNATPDGVDFEGDPNYQVVANDGSGTIAVISPFPVTAVGSPSAYGTYGQGGSVEEWMETASDGSNDFGDERRGIRGGGYTDHPDYLSSYYSTRGQPDSTGAGIPYVQGFRVASIPEPSSALLLAAAGGTLLLRRRR